MAVVIVGGGLAGCEAAWQAARRGVSVTLYEMKPERYSPAHHSPDFAELVCSNSLRSDVHTNAVGLLKEEMRRLSSLVLTAADENRRPRGKGPGRRPQRLLAPRHRRHRIAPPHRGRPRTRVPHPGGKAA